MTTKLSNERSSKQLKSIDPTALAQQKSLVSVRVFPQVISGAVEASAHERLADW